MTSFFPKSNFKRILVLCFCLAVMPGQRLHAQFSTLFTEDFEGCGVATLPITCGTNTWSDTGTGSRWTTTNGLCIIGGLYSLAVGSDATFCELAPRTELPMFSFPPRDFSYLILILIGGVWGKLELITEKLFILMMV